MASRPLSVLIGALGGEGGGVLTDWLVSAASTADLPVQSTSIPGVAQRTGATTYYVEIHPETNTALAGKRPLMALYPCPGDVDMVVVTELVEAGRALENGYVSPDRTTLIAATHRVYAVVEKAAMGDGRVNSEPILKAARALAKRPILFDAGREKSLRGQPLNAVLLGAIAGSEVLPIPRSHFEDAIRASGIAVDANLAGFAAGMELAGKPPAEEMPEPPAAVATTTNAIPGLPAAAQPIAAEGLRRLREYQSERYAQLYLDRLGRIAKVAPALAQEVARQLALWMAYEDVIRVAQLKTAPARLEAVRVEARAKPDEPVHVTEFLKPGIEEIAAILPRGIGAALLRWGERKNRLDRLRMPMELRTTTVWGFFRLWLLARMRGLRPRSLRYAAEQAMIERWLDAIERAASRDEALAAEIVATARLLKGYGDTHRRGRGNFERLFAEAIEPAIASPSLEATARVKRAREAALQDPEGRALEAALAPATTIKAAAE
ncbi:MAG TPA: indolepyruvate oxidoreductase subunit beta family protein [Stellaceae bacterium]|nr:indolepyruvate oxidoreductase subunit beta family protein [Stellaceae bacterium]